MTAVVIVQGVAILLLGALVIGLLRSHAEILKSLHELGAAADVGDPTPRAAVPVELGVRRGHDVTGVHSDGAATAIGVVGASHNTLLAFLSTTCLTCAPFWEALTAGVDLPPNTRLVVVVQDEDSDRRLRGLVGGARLTVVKSSAAWESYEIPGSPHFVMVEGSTGRLLGEGTGNTWEQVADLLQHASQGLLRADADDRDNPTRIDHELAAAGITAGHPSLYRSLEPPQDRA
jgi:hypothetical protein